MSWNIAPVDRKVFERNTLEAVVCQLQFNPILKVDQKISDFQEQVRSRFPNFSVVPVKNITFSKDDQVDLSEEKQFLFKKENSEDSIFLTTDAIAFETRKYTKRSDFLSDVKLGFDSLTNIHGKVIPRRLGVRFINSIHREQIQDYLKRTVEWRELIKDGFLSVPENLYNLSDSCFLNEVTSTCDTGKLTLRYGILPDPKSPPCFRLDIDRYLEGNFDISRSEEFLKLFTNETFALFTQVLKPLLIEWMGEKNADG